MRRERLLVSPHMVLVMMAVAACTGASPTFCSHHSEAAECIGAAPGRCTSDDQCSGATPACDVSESVCVACTASDIGGCSGTTPICSVDHTCRGCQSGSECSSDACLPDSGACGDDSTVAYVDATGSPSSDCTKLAPCSTIARALATARPFVKVHGTVDESVTISSGTVTLFGDPGAKLTHTASEPLVDIVGSPNVSFVDLEITGSLSPFPGIRVTSSASPRLSLRRVTVDSNGAEGIQCMGGTLSIDSSTIRGNFHEGVYLQNTTATIVLTTVVDNLDSGIAQNFGSLVLSRSTVSGNKKLGYQLTTDGGFNIVGNVFVGNGSLQATVGGGVLIPSTVTTSANHLEFNSFAGNRHNSGAGAAITCDLAGFTAKNNVMSGNTAANDGPRGPAIDQAGGVCAHVFSIANGGAVPAGDENTGSDPLFVNPATGDLHVRSTSPARGAADPASDLTGPAALDIDGDTRVKPADIGADQVPSQP